MNKWQYIAIAGALLVAGGIFWLSYTPEKTNWKATYSRKDKNPFGCYVTYELLPGLVDSEVRPIPYSIYDIVDRQLSFERVTSDDFEATETTEYAEPSEEATEEIDPESKEVRDYIQALIDSSQNREFGQDQFITPASPLENFLSEPNYSAPRFSFVFINHYVQLNANDTEALLQHLNNGNTALMAANHFQFSFPGLDKINIDTVPPHPEDSILLQINKGGHETGPIPFKPQSVQHYFNFESPFEYHTIGTNNYGNPVLIDIPVGEGHLYLSSTPKAYTNYHIIKKFSEPYPAKSLGLLNKEPVFWCGNYESDEARTMPPPPDTERSLLSFIHSQPSLTWAFYLALGGLIFFLLLQMKRRERVIPEQKEVSNSTLDFVNSISRLYFLRGNIADIAHKKIRYFNEYIRSRYYVQPSTINQAFIERLSDKSGVQQEQIHQLFTYIELIGNKDKVSREELIELNKLIEQFKTQSFS